MLVVIDKDGFTQGIPIAYINRPDEVDLPKVKTPNWINERVQEELSMFEGYAYNNNMALDLSVKDRFGNPVFIQGASLDGSKPRLNRPSPFLPSTFFSGGTL